MTLKRCKGRKLSGVLSLLVILSISFAVLVALATLLPAVSAGPINANASVNPTTVNIGYPTTVTLTVTSSVNVTEDVPVDVMHVIDRSGSMNWYYDDAIHNSSGKLTFFWIEIDSFDVEPSVKKFGVRLVTNSSDDDQYLRIESPSGKQYDSNNAPSGTTYDHYPGRDYIGLDKSSMVEKGTWKVYARGDVVDRPYDLTVQVGPQVRLDAAKDAATTSVDLMGDQDQIGVVSFSSSAPDTPNQELTLLDTPQNKKSVKDAIDGLSASSSHFAAIGDGIEKAKRELTSERSRDDALKVMVLLSNGVNTAVSDPRAEAHEAKNESIRIFTVGLGEADRELLQDIADITGGEYYYAANGSDLEGIYETISEDITAIIRRIHVYYMLPEGIEYADNATIEPDIIGNMLIWDLRYLGPSNPWTVSFDLVPAGKVESIPANISLNVVPYSRVIYETTNVSGKYLVTAGGCWILSPEDPAKKATFGFVVMSSDPEPSSGSLEFQDHATGMNLHSESIDNLTVSGNIATFSGAARVNGESGYEFIVIVEDNEESGDTFMIWITGDGFSYFANGTVKGGSITIHKYSSEYALFPALFMNVTATKSVDMKVFPSGGLYIGQPVGITGYAIVNNPGSEVDVSVKLCVDYYPTMGYTTSPTRGQIISKNISIVNAGETSPSINVSATWIPMSSGRHSISIYVHQLKADGTEFWLDAQGPNNETKYKTIHIKRVIS